MTGTQATAVAAREVRRAFGDQQVLAGVDLTIRRGEFVALLGHSGSGKSTLLRGLAGLDAHIEGSLRVPGARAMVFQNPRLLPWKRVLANVTFALRGAGRIARAEAALAEVGLADKQRAWPLTLSGGEAQRVSLARALVREPELLLLDEPFGALDALTRLRMYELLRQLWRRHRPTVLHVTHDVDEAVLLADRVLVLSSGSISLELPIELPAPRSRDSAEFSRLRRRLLAELGVDEQIDTAQEPT
ncbi:ABC transporter ATP-binding protein [Saccharopolyspora sp. K220]|uniref:ABC transporter ATP-binding protein n=1 Tax=Saccharopolyspora soli TaxID=2926618 RepID=UPI001F5AE497|nr:ABC transporter ATP-binding protein [Saccharopolyspora soli]MCI2419492.1 ABC transporter ATP-binding protein [Saccharopolyspora soli]